MTIGWATKTAAKRKLSVPHRSITSMIYVSTASPGLEQDDFQAIMATSQRNNQRFGITGLLVFNGFNFMQCLEGDRSAANELLNRIRMDERHSGMTLLGHQETFGRQFSQWNMAGQYLPVKQGLAQEGLSAILADAAVTAATRTLFQSFRSLGAKTPEQ
tara:strand:- start:2625 stop:3101 length:477 start_codon:yes stop_codon:yes gene_type:complete